MLNARGCADGRSQHEYTTNQRQVTTVSLEAKMQACAIDTKEGRHVTITNIPWAFLHTNLKEDIHMVLEGEIAKLIIKLEPKLYKKYV